MATSQLRERAAPISPSVQAQPAAAAADLRDPRYQAFWMLRLAFTAIPLAMGIDKSTGPSTWPTGSTTSFPARLSR
jgi:hypothetical protein